jgi:hypothetical protein
MVATVDERIVEIFLLLDLSTTPHEEGWLRHLMKALSKKTMRELHTAHLLG